MLFPLFCSTNNASANNAVHMFFYISEYVSLGYIPKARLLSQRVNKHVILLDFTKPHSMGIVPFCTPQVCVFIFPIAPSTVCCQIWTFANLTGKKWYLSFIHIPFFFFFCKGDYNLFICVRVISFYSEVPVHVFCPFFSLFLVFIVLIFKSAL